MAKKNVDPNFELNAEPVDEITALLAQGIHNLKDIKEATGQQIKTIDQYWNTFWQIICDELHRTERSDNDSARGSVAKSTEDSQMIYDDWLCSLGLEETDDDDFRTIVGDQINTMWVYFVVVCFTGSPGLALWASKKEQFSGYDYGDELSDVVIKLRRETVPLFTELYKRLSVQGTSFYEFNQD